MQKILVILVVIVLVAVAGWYQFGRAPVPHAVAGGTIVPNITVPELAGNALIGSRIFAANCAACHGEKAGGLDGAGPPLVHKIYEPSHHGDASFLLAVRNGVRSHHWKFGNMAPVEGLSDADVAMVVEFVRAVQRENGVF